MNKTITAAFIILLSQFAASTAGFCQDYGNYQTNTQDSYYNQNGYASDLINKIPYVNRYVPSSSGTIQNGIAIGINALLKGAHRSIKAKNDKAQRADSYLPEASNTYQSKNQDSTYNSQSTLNQVDASGSTQSSNSTQYKYASHASPETLRQMAMQSPFEQLKSAREQAPSRSEFTPRPERIMPNQNDKWGLAANFPIQLAQGGDDTDLFAFPSENDIEVYQRKIGSLTDPNCVDLNVQDFFKIHQDGAAYRPRTRGSRNTRKY